jgi:prepilin-type N-terminal cleavage/methylation domain-containing protein
VKRANAAGFSLTEVLIALSIFLLLMTAVSKFFGGSISQVSSINRSLLARRILEEQISKVLAQPGAFPRVLGKKEVMTYVACFNREGKPIPNSLGSTAFTLVEFEKRKWSELSGYCRVSKGVGLTPVFEFHVRPQAGDSLDRIHRLNFVFYTMKASKIDIRVETVLDFPTGI